MDPTVATGAAAIMAVRVLLDHDVPEENIYLVSLIMARQGTAHVYIHVFGKDQGWIVLSYKSDNSTCMIRKHHHLYNNHNSVSLISSAMLSLSW